MITEIIMPKLGQTMEEGTVIEWLKQEGDPVRRGDVLLTIESDKATLEVEAPKKGYLRKVLIEAGETVPVLTPVGLISTDPDEAVSAHASQPRAAGPVPDEERTTTPAALPGPAAAPSPPAGGAPGRLFASPRARKTARERGVDLAAVTGTGPNGRIVEQDVLAHLAQAPRITPVARRLAAAHGVDTAALAGTGSGGRVTKADVEAAARLGAPVSVESLPLGGLRAIIAERMAASARATARVTLVSEVDATALVEARESLKQSVADEWGFAPGYTDLLGLAVARALRAFPYMNARLSAGGEAIERLPFVNLGMAVDTERGLLVPVIRDADRLGLRAFGSEFRALVERARAGRSLPDDLSGGTFTLTNLGMVGVDAFTPVINPPEAAILGAGRIRARPVVWESEIVARQTMTLSLAFDHRLVDGAPAARFLQHVARLVELPYLLLA
jgi:pyruvate dehydrogenase E2 component (dihydrolipoamide acetyltransferase)